MAKPTTAEHFSTVSVKPGLSSWGRRSASANCGRAVAHVRGSYGPRPCEKPKNQSATRMMFSDCRSGCVKPPAGKKLSECELLHITPVRAALVHTYSPERQLIFDKY